MMAKLVVRSLMSLALLIAGSMPAVQVLAELRSDKYQDWTVEKEVFVTMRDGIRLSTDIYLPKGAKGPLPTILVRSPYDRDNVDTVESQMPYLKQGYALVHQNERGRYFSEGSYDHYLEGAGTDGYDTIEWITKQPWSNGKVGTIGCSSSGEQQWPMANSRHPGHAAMIPMASGTAIGSIPGNDTQGAVYRGGIPQVGLWAWWYHDMATTERLVLPPNTTQEQRIRLRNSFSLMPKTWFYTIEPGKMDITNPKNDASKLLMQLPSKDILQRLGGAHTPFDDFVTWTPGDPRWKDVNLATDGFKSRTPALFVNSWHDVGVGEMTRMFKYTQDKKIPDQYLIVGAGPHCAPLQSNENLRDLSFGDLHVGDSRYLGRDDGYANLYLDWFENFVAGRKNNVAAMPKVQLQVMGKGWVTGNSWPLERTVFTKYYLDSGVVPGSKIVRRSLSATLAEGMASDAYLYDPANPVPTRGGSCCGDDMAVDQRGVEARADVLSYTTPVLRRAVTVAGPIEVVLYVSSSAKDTDFVVKLVDVYPDGKAINLADDGFRVRYREGFDKKVLMKQGEVYQIRLTNMVTANHFPAGHQIRLDISSSNFPAFERNLNTGGNNFDETVWVTAENEVHHSKSHPSHILLPVIPD